MANFISMQRRVRQAAVAASSAGIALLLGWAPTGLANEAVKETVNRSACEPGDDSFAEIAGTDLLYPNGIEVSADGREFYVASSGLFNVTAWSNTNPAVKLRQTEAMAILPPAVFDSCG